RAGPPRPRDERHPDRAAGLLPAELRRGEPRAPPRARARAGTRAPGGERAVAGARRGHARRPRDALGADRRVAPRRPAHARGAKPARSLGRARVAARRPLRAGGRGLTLRITALAPLPEVRPGDDLAELLVAAAPDELSDGDVLVVAHKVVSKAEGRVRA